MTDETNSEFERRTKRAFDDSVAGLDAATRSQLTQARHRALEARQSARDGGWRWALVPAGTVAAIALAVWFTVWQQPTTTDAVRSAALSDLEILLSDEDLEMLDEELEFYGWLEDQPEFAGANDNVG
jgi:anti-sigma-K factor RskA